MKKVQLFILFAIFLINNTVFCQNWQPVADVKHQRVFAFFLDSIENELYIGGAFRYFNDLDARGIVKWDGETFSTLGYFPNKCNNYNCIEVYSIIRYKDEIYCTFINGPWQPGEIRGLAKWDGIQWDSIGGVEGIVYDQVIYNDELCIMGRFRMAENDSVGTVIKWDGENWYGLDFPNFYSWWPTVTTAICGVVYNDELYVAANNLNSDNGIAGITKYDGTNWHPVADGIKGDLDNIFDMEVYKGELYVCGDFRKAAGNKGNNIMKLVGNEWAEVGGGIDGNGWFGSKMLVYNDKLYVFGIFYSVGGGVPAQNIAVWDGERWCGLGSTFDESGIGEAVEFQGDIFICGNFDTIDGVKLEHFARWTAGDYLEVCGEPVAVPEPYKELNKLTLSPNPANSTLTISTQLPSGISILTLTARNLLGQPVWQQVRPAAGGEILETVDVSAWPPGVYFITLETGGAVPEGIKVTEKVVVVR